MKLGMGVDIGMGYSAPLPCSAWVNDHPSRLTDFLGKNGPSGAFSFDNLVIFRPISMKLEMWVDININLSLPAHRYAWVHTGDA